MKRDAATENSSKTSLIFAGFFFVLSFSIFFYRIHFGVDFFDEAFYSALPLRLFFGQKLFRDELLIVQTFSVFTYPFFRMFLALNHSLEGVIFFMRSVTFGLYLLLSGFVFYFLKKEISKPIALLIAATVVLYFPGNMLTLSYNTLGTWFLTLALLFLYFGTQTTHRGAIFLAGVLMCCSAISYVTFFGVALFLCFYLLVCHPTKRLALFFGLGILVTLLYPLKFVVHYLPEFKNSLAFSKEYLHNPPTLSQGFEVLHKLFPKAVVLSCSIFFVSAYFFKRRYSSAYHVLLCLIPVLASILSYLSTSGWSTYAFYLCLLSLVFYPEIKHSTANRELFKWIFIPSSVAALTTSLSSGLGYLNAQVGLLPASLVSLIFLGQELKRLTGRVTLPILTSMAMPTLLALAYPLNIWDDSPFHELNQKIVAGPYRGIYTSFYKKQMAETTYQLMKKELNVAGPLLIYPNFSAGYLVTSIPPARGVTWYQNSGRANEILKSLYETQINPDSRVIRMKIWYGSPTMQTLHGFDPKDPLNHLIEQTHHPIKETDWFTVFAPNSAPTIAESLKR
jgi:hypothetical protein